MLFSKLLSWIGFNQSSPRHWHLFKYSTTNVECQILISIGTTDSKWKCVECRLSNHMDFISNKMWIVAFFSRKCFSTQNEMTFGSDSVNFFLPFFLYFLSNCLVLFVVLSLAYLYTFLFTHCVSIWRRCLTMVINLSAKDAFCLMKHFVSSATDIVIWSILRDRDGEGKRERAKRMS